MKKRSWLAIMGMALLLSLAGCSVTNKTPEPVKENTGGFFTLVEEYEHAGLVYRIVYANDTKVMYLLVKTIDGSMENRVFNATPLYMPDGTPQTYNNYLELREPQ